MIHAYDELYLDKAQISMGTMLNHAVNDVGFEISEYTDLFISSKISTLFECGNPNIIVGKSGIELVYEVLDSSNIPYEYAEQSFKIGRSPEYWCGWALAYYQWKTSMSFSSILERVPITDVHSMYPVFHEMDIQQFCDHMDELEKKAQPETNLKHLRTNLGISQRELANSSGVPLRTIQQYEQRQKNINKAQVDYLIKLSSALHCDITALIERI